MLLSSCEILSRTSTLSLDPLAASLALFVITSDLPLIPTVFLTHSHTSPPPPTPVFDLLSLLQGTHYLLRLMEHLKRQKQKKGERRGGPRPPPLCTSLYPPFVLRLSTIPPFTVSVTSAAPLTVVMFSLPSPSIMLCRWRWWSCRVIVSYLFENACPALVLPSI